MSADIIKVSRNTEDAPLSPFSTQSVAFSHYNNLSAQLPTDPQTGSLISGSLEDQTKQCLLNIQTIVESIGHRMHDVVRVNIYLKNIADIDAVNEIYASFFQHYVPTYTTLAVADLPLEGAHLQMDAVISNGEGTYPQAACELVKIARNTSYAPVSSLSTQTVAFSHYNHISAQLPIDPQSGSIVAGGAKEHAIQCLKNIKSILENVDVPLDDIVKVNIHVRSLDDLAAVNEVYTTFFPDSAIARAVGYMPARSVTVVEGLAMGALVQVDATVSHGDGTPPQAVEDRHGIVVKANNTKAAPISPFSTQTVAFSHYNNISAQLPLDPTIGAIVTTGAKEQTMQCLNNIKEVIESAGHVMDDIVKLNIQLRDMADLDVLNDVCTHYFDGPLPARTVIGVSDIPMGALVQIDAIASNCEGTPPSL
ncbi:RidA family protein [Vibrio lentus]|uniref:Reactive intermediate/imine deaminase n=1 Tax=Vibrio lentus TaxID=136468 RepID=A0A855IKZ6_9VIBR|nr:RidA family protein [Vibrio lentus]PMJ63978.1 reactive intermediate/imine deaminase [Vibrio lentus]PMJ82665.1 reactive intermediate/imine deaminase [Vibrio lentus]PMM53234.1 reactive intermediate/imine deaminase [Vibrio lentus]PMM53745.1 reactive intermediate/imine deaminase [Vibrio lentus]PMN34688.1 reactive intermediate/imine deaminase [Vibrio lentus]